MCVLTCTCQHGQPVCVALVPITQEYFVIKTSDSMYRFNAKLAIFFGSQETKVQGHSASQSCEVSPDERIGHQTWRHTVTTTLCLKHCTQLKGRKVNILLYDCLWVRASNSKKRKVASPRSLHEGGTCHLGHCVG